MWVNLVSNAVMQPMRLPTRKLAQNMPKKSRIACIIERVKVDFLTIIFFLIVKSP